MGSGVECPLQITVHFPMKTERNKPIELIVDINGNPDVKDPNLFLPKPIQPATIINEVASMMYQVPILKIVICNWRACDIFSDLSAVGDVYQTSNSPLNLRDAEQASFASSSLSIPTEGRYTGFVHAAVLLNEGKRADFVTYFPIQIGNVPGTLPRIITADGITTYCWKSAGSSILKSQILVDSDLSTNNFCPGHMQLDLEKSQVKVNEKIRIAWTMRMDLKSRNSSSLLANIAPDQMVVDQTTHRYSNDPVSTLSLCDIGIDKEQCLSFTGKDFSSNILVTIADRSLIEGAATYEIYHSFDLAGDFIIMSRVAMQSVDGYQVDMALYSRIQVYGSRENINHKVLFASTLAVSLFLIVFLGILFYCKKKRSVDDLKGIPVRKPFPQFYFDTPQQLHENRSKYFRNRASTLTSNTFFQTTPTHGKHHLPSERDEQYPDTQIEALQHLRSLSGKFYASRTFRDLSYSEQSDQMLDSRIVRSSSEDQRQNVSDWGLSIKSDTSDPSLEQSGVPNFDLPAKVGTNMPILEVPITMDESSSGRDRMSSSWTIDTR